ncbi:hypothetical protein HT576_04830 [Haloterrigena sp. SYSU A121-1]|uniref:Uncharacterized protein n=1 Tax=Haloterrigena gelatinilytica TaxID=2741724 RepID=A0A8J8GM75_9EURY|nr:hypothetical protein [Haloterrigena gelatinilytica]NUB90362.1 hypothetical protein [Haloterrigena gelatinilytica]
MSLRTRYWRVEAYLERHPVPYYGLLFLCPLVTRVGYAAVRSDSLVTRVGYAAVRSEPLADAARSGIVFATTFVLVTALMRSILD